MTLVLCAVIFFAFFGFADKVRKNYRLAYTLISKRVGISLPELTSPMGKYVELNFDFTAPELTKISTNPMPVFNTHQSDKKRDSLALFSLRMSSSDYGGTSADVKNRPFSPTATTAASMWVDSQVEFESCGLA